MALKIIDLDKFERNQIDELRVKYRTHIYTLKHAHAEAKKERKRKKEKEI